MVAAMPDRPYGMNHPSARQMIALRDLRIARLAAMERPALREELRPRRLMDRAIYPAPAQKCRAGGIHDGIDFHFCNIVSNDLKWHGFHPFWSRVWQVCEGKYGFNRCPPWLLYFQARREISRFE